MSTIYITYRLGAVASLIFCDRKYDSPLSARVYYGITVGWMRIPLGTEVCLGPGDIVESTRQCAVVGYRGNLTGIAI